MPKTISAVQAATPDHWYRARYQYDYDSATWTQDIYFHIAQTEFDVPFHYAELVNYAPDLGDYTWTGDEFYAGQRDIAVSEMYGRLINANHDPLRILNRSALNVAFAYLWLRHIFLTLSKSPEDMLWVRSEAYFTLYDDAFSAVDIIEAATAETNIGDDAARPLTRTKLTRG